MEHIPSTLEMVLGFGGGVIMFLLIMLYSRVKISDFITKG